MNGLWARPGGLLIGRRCHNRKTGETTYKIDILAKELDGRLADLFGVVIGVTGDGEGADSRQQSPESAACDALNNPDPDAPARFQHA